MPTYQSLSFAQKIQKQYGTLLNTPNRGVFQAGFVVLWGCTMPSVLTEIGFISNPEEEEFLSSADGQDKIAISLLNAFREYKYQVEGFGNQAGVSSATSSATQTTIAPATQTTTPSATQTTTQSAAQITNAPATTPAAETIIFKVQFASSSINKPLNSPEFNVLQNISKYQENGVYKYCSGEETDLLQAKNLLQEIQAKGFRDAFVVAFKNGKRISMSEALRK